MPCTVPVLCLTKTQHRRSCSDSQLVCTLREPFLLATSDLLLATCYLQCSLLPGSTCHSHNNLIPRDIYESLACVFRSIIGEELELELEQCHMLPSGAAAAAAAAAVASGATADATGTLASFLCNSNTMRAKAGARMWGWMCVSTHRFLLTFCFLFCSLCVLLFVS